MRVHFLALTAALLAGLAVQPTQESFSSRPDLGAQTAGFVFATIPQLILFAFGMKYFIQGLTSGSVKA